MLAVLSLRPLASFPVSLINPQVMVSNEGCGSERSIERMGLFGTSPDGAMGHLHEYQ